jgi:ribonuclease VapC
VIVDSSVLVAILKGETDAQVFHRVLHLASINRLSAGNFVETATVIDAYRDPVLSQELDDLLIAFRITIEPVTESQARIARQAYRDFGKGSGHKAKLNLGDCFAYALARETGEPLLYKGNDFLHTGIASALKTN